jgi:peroxiredoxin
LAAEQTAFAACGVKVVAISTDDRDGCREIEEVTGGAFAVLSDTGANAIRDLDLIDPFEIRPAPIAFPAAFLVDDSGIVRYQYVGRAPEDRPRTTLLLLAAERMTRPN